MNKSNKRERTYTTTARLSIQNIAALVKYYSKRGEEFSSRNQALRVAINHLVDALDLPTQTVEESIRFLRHKNLFSEKNSNHNTVKVLEEEQRKIRNSTIRDGVDEEAKNDALDVLKGGDDA